MISTEIPLSNSLKNSNSQSIHTPICIIGAGTGGVNFAAQLIKENGISKQQIRIFEPSKFHHYQPGWTMIGAGIINPDQAIEATEKILPKGINITPLAVNEIQPQNNAIITENGQVYTYEHTNPGAREALEDPNIPVGSTYDKRYSEKYNKLMNEFKGGKAIFTNPPDPIKCQGAPLQIAFLSEECWRKKGIRKNIELEYHSAQSIIFPIPKYANELNALVQRKNIIMAYETRLVEIKGKERIAIFEDNKTHQRHEIEFDLLHVVPLMCPHNFIKNSETIADDTGYVDIDPLTLQHKRYPNIWGLGDASNVPTSKSGEVVLRQTPILVYNVMTVWRNKDINKNQRLAIYNGYTACPILTGDKQALLVEYRYHGILDQTLGSFENKPRWVFYLMDIYLFRWTYFYLMPIGRWYGRYGIFKPHLKKVGDDK